MPDRDPPTRPGHQDAGRGKASLNVLFFIAFNVLNIRHLRQELVRRERLVIYHLLPHHLQTGLLLGTIGLCWDVLILH
jgi:hypothetical protein